MKKFKTYTFWISLLGAVIVLINALGTTFGFGVDEVAITSIVTAILGVFVTLGLIKKDKTSESTNSTEQPSQENFDESSVSQEKEFENKDDKE